MLKIPHDQIWKTITREKKSIDQHNRIKLDLIIKNLKNQKEHGWMVVFAGQLGTKKSELLSNLFALNHEYRYFPAINNDFNNDIKSFFWRKHLYYDPNLIYYRHIKLATIENLVTDINSNIRYNLTQANMQQWKYLKAIKAWLNNLKLKRVNKILLGVEKAIDNAKSLEQSKSMWPILTIVNTLGTSIGTPILSVSLFRETSIIKLFGEAGYSFLVGISLTLIIISVFSVLTQLFSNISVNKTSNITTNFSWFYTKLLVRYFDIEDRTKTIKNKRFWKKWFNNKIAIRTRLNYFYDGLNKSDAQFQECMQLMDVLRDMNNNVYCTVDIEHQFQYQNIFDNSLINKRKRLLWKPEGVSLGANNWVTIQFLLENLSQLLQIDAFELYRHDVIFGELIYAFSNYVQTENQLLQFLIFCKTYYKKINQIFDLPFVVDYFRQTLSIVILKVLNIDMFDELAFHLVNNLNIEFNNDQFNLNNFINLKIKQLLNNNWKLFGQNAIIFKMSDFFDHQSFYDIMVKYQALKSSLIDNSDEIISFTERFLTQNQFVSANDESSYLKNLYWNGEILTNPNGEKVLIVKFNETLYLSPQQYQELDVFDQIYQIKKTASHLRSQYILVIWDDYFLIMHKNFNDYEIVINF